MPSKNDFREWMINTNHLSVRTSDKYSVDCPVNENVKTVLRRIAGVSNMYAITSVSRLTSAAAVIRDMDFDITGKHMYSCGIKKYIQYLQATGEATV